MNSDKLNIAVDIAKVKLYFFSALAGGIWFQLSSKMNLYNIILSIVFITSVVGVVKNLLLLGKYEKEIKK